MCAVQDAVEYAECEAAVKEYPPFVDAMRKRGIEDMDLVMVDPWYDAAHERVVYCLSSCCCGFFFCCCLLTKPCGFALLVEGVSGTTESRIPLVVG